MVAEFLSVIGISSLLCCFALCVNKIYIYNYILYIYHLRAVVAAVAVAFRFSEIESSNVTSYSDY